MDSRRSPKRIIDTGLNLEAKTKLGFELAMQSALGCDVAKRVRAVNAQTRRSRCGVIQDIGGIGPDLHAFGLRNPKCFGKIPVQAPGPGQLHSLTAYGSSCPRLWILKQNLADRCIRDRSKRTETLEVHRKGQALGIGGFSEILVSKIALSFAKTSYARNGLILSSDHDTVIGSC
jgi:hypothetical protein